MVAVSRSCLALCTFDAQIHKQLDLATYLTSSPLPPNFVEAPWSLHRVVLQKRETPADV